MTTLTVERAIASYHRGNAYAFITCFDEYAPVIYRFCLHRTLDREIAEASLERIFFMAFDNFRHFTGASSRELLIWLYRISIKVLTEIDIHDNFSEDRALALTSQASEKIALSEVISLFILLDVEHRNVLIMKLWDGLSYGEISDILLKDSGVCKQIAFRAIRMIREGIVHDTASTTE